MISDWMKYICVAGFVAVIYVWYKWISVRLREVCKITKKPNWWWIMFHVKYLSLCFSLNNKRSSSVLECKIPERLSWPRSAEHYSGQFILANSASYNSHTTRWWSKWYWLHFSQHWGVYGIREKWKFTWKWHLWRYNTILFYVFDSLSLSSWFAFTLLCNDKYHSNSCFCFYLSDLRFSNVNYEDFCLLGCNTK